MSEETQQKLQQVLTDFKASQKREYCDFPHVPVLRPDILISEHKFNPSPLFD